jgi:hypothetical protein
MDIDQLVGSQIQVRAADLFELPLAAAVRAVDPGSNSVLLEFSVPVQMDTHTYRFAVARPRLQRDNLIVLFGKAPLGCALTLVPDDRYDSANPFDLSWWRGGGAAIADLVLQSG